MNSQPLVSIVIPMYNADKYLHECIDSILNQSYKNLQIIIVDDGSTDSSKNIVKNYMKKDKRIELIEQENLYAGVARNNGMKYAVGKYIMFLDADDFFDESMIEKMCSKAEETDADIIICDSQKYDQEKERFDILPGALNREYLPQKEVFSKEDIPDTIFLITDGFAWNKLYRLSFVKEKKIFFQNTHTANDQLFVAIAFAEAKRIAIVKDILVNYRTNVGTSLAYNRHKWWKCSFDMYEELKNDLIKRNLFDKLKKSYVNRVLEYILGYIITIDSYDIFNDYFIYLKSEGLVQIGINLNRDIYVNDYLYEQAVNIIKFDIGEYLINSRNEILADRNEILADRNEIAYCYRKYFSESNSYIEQVNRKKKWVFSEKLVANGSRIIVYGYGEVGQDFCWQIMNSKHYELVGVIDKNYKLLENYSEVEFIDLNCLSELNYDYILIAIMKKETAMEVKKMLIEKGCDDNKIVWVDLY